MSWKQVRKFDPKKMGKVPGWCLQNCRLGFGIKKGKFASAKADMESQRKNGTLHTGNPPVNVSVPVYVDSPSKYEHVEVCDYTQYYSDGKKVNQPKKVFGWGELCDGVRVVKYVEDVPSFLPSKGYWCYGDKDERIGRLSSFMYKTFPAYTNKKALGNFYGHYIRATIREFQRRTNLDATGSVDKKTYAMLKKYGFKG